ncbi:hypothetical protein AXG93_2839s1280 [Marchantia polymorpha subsp. ruderalis]|uniref:HTH CENPB-type domain-containing protein n=1 Tax=Marchantia polymorpha subsp. ruderalis TaxID=1480154 RepID=A0A176VF80_MARPO|nr:hypothetical protein AXG93_2839s1280 [Marchantia polymorpha subsp. ruderalis]
MLYKLYPDHDRNFKFSNGWMEVFKKRHNIRSHQRFGDSGSVNKQIIDESIPRLRETLDKFEWKDIYNMDETGFFFPDGVLLILDNCSAHISVDEVHEQITLCNTTILYLPPNTTSKIKHCDKGINRNFKAYYRCSFNCLLLQRLDDKVEQPEKIDVLQAIQMFRYPNPTDIRNLLNYSAEDKVAYVPDVDDVINDQLSNVADDGGNADDHSQEYPSINPTEA